MLRSARNSRRVGSLPGLFPREIIFRPSSRAGFGACFAFGANEPKGKRDKSGTGRRDGAGRGPRAHLRVLLMAPSSLTCSHSAASGAGSAAGEYWRRRGEKPLARGTSHAHACTHMRTHTHTHCHVLHAFQPAVRETHSTEASRAALGRHKTNTQKMSWKMSEQISRV